MCLPREQEDIKPCRCAPEAKVKVDPETSFKVTDWLAGTPLHLNLTMGTNIKKPSIAVDGKKLSQYQDNINNFHQIKTVPCSIVTQIRNTHNNTQSLQIQGKKRLLSGLAATPITVPAGSLTSSDSSSSLSSSLPSAGSYLDTPRLDTRCTSESSVDSLDVPNLDLRRVSDPGAFIDSSPQPSSDRRGSFNMLWKKMVPTRMGQREMNVLAPVSL